MSLYSFIPSAPSSPALPASQSTSSRASYPQRALDDNAAAVRTSHNCTRNVRSDEASILTTISTRSPVISRSLLVRSRLKCNRLISHGMCCCTYNAISTFAPRTAYSTAMSMKPTPCTSFPVYIVFNCSTTASST